MAPSSGHKINHPAPVPRPGIPMWPTGVCLKCELVKCDHRLPTLRIGAFTTCVKCSVAMVSLGMTVRFMLWVSV